jgi:hypothetical protein
MLFNFDLQCVSLILRKVGLCATIFCPEFKGDSEEIELGQNIIGSVLAIDKSTLFSKGSEAGDVGVIHALKTRDRIISSKATL